MADDSGDLTRKLPLPLDDPHWKPLTEVFEERRRQTGNATLAARDLTDDLRQGRIRCMRCKLNLRLPGPDRELVPKEFWDRYEVRYLSDGLQIVERPVRPSLSWRLFRGSVFYVWEPDAVVAPSPQPPANPLPEAVRKALREATDRVDATVIVLLALSPAKGMKRETVLADVNKCLTANDWPGISLKTLGRARKRIRNRNPSS